MGVDGAKRGARAWYCLRSAGIMLTMGMEMGTIACTRGSTAGVSHVVQPAPHVTAADVTGGGAVPRFEAPAMINLEGRMPLLTLGRKLWSVSMVRTTDFTMGNRSSHSG